MSASFALFNYLLRLVSFWDANQTVIYFAGYLMMNVIWYITECYTCIYEWKCNRYSKCPKKSENANVSWLCPYTRVICNQLFICVNYSSSSNTRKNVLHGFLTKFRNVGKWRFLDNIPFFGVWYRLKVGLIIWRTTAVTCSWKHYGNCPRIFLWQLTKAAELWYY